MPENLGVPAFALALGPPSAPGHAAPSRSIETHPDTGSAACERDKAPPSRGKLSPEDQHTFNRWLKANAIVGAIFAIGLIAMALAGVAGPSGPACRRREQHD